MKLHIFLTIQILMKAFRATQQNTLKAVSYFEKPHNMLLSGKRKKKCADILAHILSTGDRLSFV